MIDVPTAIRAEHRHRLIEREVPGRIEPMLATLTHQHFSDPGWIHERKEVRRAGIGRHAVSIDAVRSRPSERTGR